MGMRGIDVSAYNAVTDYYRVAADNVDFAIIKVIRKDSQPDRLFETHWKGFENAGIPIQGVYNYSYATTTAKFRWDAQRVLEVLAGRKTMVWLDIEDRTLAGLGRSLVDGIRAYADVIRNAGLSFGIYTYISFFQNNLKRYEESLDFPFWVARYPSSKALDIETDPNPQLCPRIGKTLYGWQYSCNGIVEGITGAVDLNEWFVESEAENMTTEAADGTTKTEPDRTTAASEKEYIQEGFCMELAELLGLDRKASAEEVLAGTMTISTGRNRSHASVTALERLLRAYGYYAGEIETDQGKTPVFGSGMAKATVLYQSRNAGFKRPDKEWTAGSRSYQTALHLR